MPDPEERARLLDPAQDPPRARYGHLAAPYVLPWQDRTDAARAALQEAVEVLAEVWLEVHHIEPLAGGGEPYDEVNLVTVCNGCHADVAAGRTGYLQGWSPRAWGDSETAEYWRAYEAAKRAYHEATAEVT